ncbi:MAG: TadE family protein [Candidatus Dormibacteria bacterium]
MIPRLVRYRGGHGRPRGTRRGQTLVEMALIAPLLVLLIAGVGDLGRAFYFKIATTNTAREAAHWATLLDSSNSAPTDSEITTDVAAPSQESFGINLVKAPDSIVNDQPPLTIGAEQTKAGVNLAPSTSWLFVSPSRSGRTALLRGQHYRVVAQSTRVIWAPPPSAGGLGQVLRAIAPLANPVQAEAASSNCYSFGLPTVTPTPPIQLAAGQTQFSFSGSVSNVVGTGPADNEADLLLTSPTGFGISSSWSPAAATTSPQGQVILKNNAATPSVDTVNLPRPLNVGESQSFTLTATSSGGTCTAPTQSISFAVNGPLTGPSPSPSPSPSPVASPSAPVPSPSVSAAPPPTPGSTLSNKQITCTVIYYLVPITPVLGLFATNNAIYIVGSATLEGTY